MAVLTLEERGSIERALGIIEGIACGVPESAASMLYTAVEIVDAVLSGGDN
ncbi:MAG: hypothetical protein IIV05_01560 [Ruminococcus sp.]|nr:hypothetical protein [Ruminococcus sp.]